MIPNHGDFLSDQFGGRNWVLARRTSRIVSRYGDDVICVSQERYRRAETEWRKLYGDPHDKARAAMYCALVRMEEALRVYTRNGFDGLSFANLNDAARDARAAIKAEQDRT